MNSDELQAVLDAHERWLDVDGDGERAHLRNADLRDAHLRHSDLQDAVLREAYLQDADLRGADLRHADLWHVDLRHADLRGAVLQDADLRGADLRHADLRGAVLQDAYLRGADLRHSDLQEADLPRHERLPETGAFDAYKGCLDHVVKLRVPEDADRTSSLIGPKCRAEYVEVLEVLDAGGEPCEATEATGWYDEETVYHEGETVHPDDWDDDIRVECTHGIHLYPTQHEAVEAVR